MKIYTKAGDGGHTSLFGGQRVSKADALVDAYGTLDETNALLGVARASGVPPELDELLEGIQNELFVAGAEIACPAERRATLKLPLVGSAETERFEAAIDRLEERLEPLRSFVLPAGSAGASALHHARAVCRRAERLVVAVAAEAQLRPELIAYLNRLSDLLFVMARVANVSAGISDVLWAPRKAPGSS
jgi:cob(I)alamin adenosyltransferase